MTKLFYYMAEIYDQMGVTGWCRIFRQSTSGLWLVFGAFLLAGVPDLAAEVDRLREWLAAQPTPSQAGMATPATADLSTTVASTEWNNWLEAGHRLSAERAVHRRQLMETDPARFAATAWTPAERALLPEEIRPLVEEWVAGSGRMTVQCVLPKTSDQTGATHHSHAGLLRWANLNGHRYRAFVEGEWRALKTGSWPHLEGYVLGDGIALTGKLPTAVETSKATGQDNVMESVPPSTTNAPSTTGPNTLLYIIARFSDESTDPISPATALTQMAAVNQFWLDNSGGIVSIKGRVNTGQPMDIVSVTLPQPRSYAAFYDGDLGELLDDSRTAAANAGFNYSQYNLDITVTSDAGFSYAGVAYVGAQGLHLVAGYTSLRTSAHELGHNLGLFHANYWRSDATQPYGRDRSPGGYVTDTNNAEWIEYGHYFDNMAGQGGADWDNPELPHYSAIEKADLGWFSGAEIQAVSTSGLYRIYRMDSRNTVGVPRALRLTTPATDPAGLTRYYWLSYRYAPWTATSGWTRRGLIVEVAQSSYSDDGAILLDMTPFSRDDSTYHDPAHPEFGFWLIDTEDKADGTLPLGKTYVDASAQIRITPTSINTTQAGEEYIEVNVVMGAVTNQAPILTELNGPLSLAVGQSGQFTVLAGDPDGDPLSYYWDFSDPEVAPGSADATASTSHAWSTAGVYRVLVRISDRRGGEASRAWIVTVGQPANPRQWRGRVLWAGRGMGGVLVTGGSSEDKEAVWTATDGAFALVGLPATGGTWTIEARRDDLALTPAGPISLNPEDGDRFDLAWENAAVFTPAGRYSISGRVTDGSVGVAGVVVETGGLSAVTSSQGDYVINGLIPGQYTVVVSHRDWSFSPSSQAVTIVGQDAFQINFARRYYTVSGKVTGLSTGIFQLAPTVYCSNGTVVFCQRQFQSPTTVWAYSISVPAGQFSLTSEKSGYRISPGNFTNPLTIQTNLTNVDFAGVSASIAGAIRGRIVLADGSGRAGVSVAIKSGVTVATTAVSDSDGYFRCNALSGGTYSIEPSGSGFTFLPSTQTVSSLPASGVNFTAQPSIPAAVTLVTAQPTFLNGPGQAILLTANATGTNPLTYRWSALSGATGVNYTPAPGGDPAGIEATPVLGGDYLFRVEVQDALGLKAMGSVRVPVYGSSGGAVALIPYDLTTPLGSSINFTAQAWDGAGLQLPAPSLTWQADSNGWVPSGGGAYRPLRTGGLWTMEVSEAGGGSGQAWVQTLPLAFNTAPVAVAGPFAQSVAAGASFTVEVYAYGQPIPAYQWLLNGQPISGATAAQYSVAQASAADAGQYSVQLTNSAGQTTAGPALVTVMGTFSSWILHFGLSGADAQPGADSDGDGLSNLLEYAFGFSPVLPQTGVIMPRGSAVTVDPVGPWLQIAFRQRQGGVGTPGLDYVADGVHYLVETTADLTSILWQSGSSWLEVRGTPVNNGDGTETVTIRLKEALSPDQVRYLRLRIVDQ